jgi:hypothetical protein
MKCNFNIDLLLRIRKNHKNLTDAEKFFLLIAKGDLKRLQYYIPTPPED